MYETYTYEYLLERMLTRAQNIDPDVDVSEGSLIYNTLAVEAWELAEAYINISTVYDNVFAETASRDELILIANERGISLREATAAIGKGEFNIDIPISSRFSLDALNYTAIEKISDGVYKMQCETAGSEGNKKSGELIPIEYIEGLSSAMLTEILIQGEDEEDIESLRERYLNYIRSPSTSGNKDDYYNWAMECSGVGAVKVFPLADGPGTVKLVIADSDKKKAASALIEEVSDHIESLRPIGADARVVSVEEKPIVATAKIKLKNGINLGTVQSAFFNAFSQYLSNNAFYIDYISIAKIGNILLDIDGVEDYSDLKLNGSPANIVLEQEEVAVCESVSLEVM